MSSALSTLFTVVLLGGLVWLAFQIEPHWVSKDGRKMIARVQPLSSQDQPDGRWREMRIFIDGTTITVNSRGLSSFGLRGTYRVAGKSPAPPRRREIYILNGERRILLRVPASSRAVPVLEALLD